MKDSTATRQDATRREALERAVEMRAPVTLLLGFPAVALYGHLDGLNGDRLGIRLPLSASPPPSGHHVMLQLQEGAHRIATYATVTISSTMMEVVLSGRLHMRAA